MATQSTPPAQSKESSVKNICQNCSVPCNQIDASPEGFKASSSPLSASREERPVQGVSTEDRESLPSAGKELQTSPIREGADHGVRSLAQYIRGRIYNSSLSLRKMLCQRSTIYIGFALYAAIAVTVHLLRVNKRYPLLSAIPFSAHLTWLATTSSFCCLLWLAILLDHTKTVPELRADVASALSKSKSKCNIVDWVSDIAIHTLMADSILTVRWFIKCLFELMPGYEIGTWASILVWVSCWIICIVVVALGVLITYGLNLPLDAFGESLKKCQQETSNHAGSKAPLIQSKTEKPRGACIVNKDADPQSNNAPENLSPISFFPLAVPATGIPETTVLLGYSIQLAVSFWLFILYFTWLEVELALDTPIFVYWLCIAPRWWATAFSLYILCSTASLKGSLYDKHPKAQELLNRATVEQAQLLTKARSFVSSLILSVDLLWPVVILCKKMCNSDYPYQDEKENWDLVFYALLPFSAFAWIPWVFFEDYKSMIAEYNGRLDKLDNKLKETTTKHKHRDLIVPDSCFSSSQLGKVRKQVQDTALSEKRESDPVLIDTQEPVEDDWQVVEQGSNDEFASNASSPFASVVAAGPGCSDAKEVQRNCDGSACEWKLLHDELHGIAWTRLANQQTVVSGLKELLGGMEAEADESEEALDRLDKKACALERGSYKHLH